MKKVNESVLEKITRAVEYCTLPAFFILWLLSFNLAVSLTAFAGVFVSGARLYLAFAKHNKGGKNA